METQVAASKTVARTQKLSAARLRQRMQKLYKNGVKTSQLAGVLGVSYNGANGFLTGRVQPSELRLADYHKKLNAWCQKIASC